MFGHSLDSFIFQIENLEKSLRDTSGSSAASISSRTRQVRELSDEVGIVDRELAAVAVEREETSRRLNSKRMNHIATLRELGEYFTCLLPSSWPNLLQILTWNDCGRGRVPKSERASLAETLTFNKILSSAVKPFKDFHGRTIISVNHAAAAAARTRTTL